MTDKPACEVNGLAEPVCPGCREPLRGHLGLHIMAGQYAATASTAQVTVAACGRCGWALGPLGGRGSSYQPGGGIYQLSAQSQIPGSVSLGASARWPDQPEGDQ